MARRSKSSGLAVNGTARHAALDTGVEACLPAERDFAALGYSIVDIDDNGFVLGEIPALGRCPLLAAAGDSLFESIALEDVPVLRLALTSKEARPIALRLLASRGAHIPVRGFALRSAGGARLFLRDETAGERRIAEADYAEEAVRFGQWRLDIATGAFEASKGFLRLLTAGAPPHTLETDWVLSHCELKERRKLKRQFLSGIKTAGRFSVQCRIARSDGQRRVLESDVVPETDSHGRLIAFCGITRDITELVIIEKELQRIDAQHRLLMNHSNDAICQLDYHGMFLFVSPAIEQMIGYRVEELVGRNVSELVHPDDIEALRASARRTNFDPGARTDQYRMLTRHGDYIWVESRVRPLMDHKRQRRIGLIAVIRDIQERKRSEEALVAAHERAEIANRAKTKFLANMSHELRTPLNAIIGFSEILSREMFGPLGSARYGEYVTLILESGRHLLDLINDLLDTAKIEAGRYELTHEVLDIEDIVSAALRLVQRQAESKTLRLEAPSIALAAPLIADQRAVKQIIINLLSNAIKFTPPGGTVRIAVTESEEHVLITVSDTGIGIPQSEVGRLARPFEQVHSDLHIAQEGTGLGLALVNSLARLHGGDIEIQSREGSGTSVIVRLPHRSGDPERCLIGL